MAQILRKKVQKYELYKRLALLIFSHKPKTCNEPCQADHAGYEDEYVLEDLEIQLSDFIQKSIKGNFAVAWDEIGLENEIEETALLSEIKTLEEGAKKIIQHLSMQACERTDNLKDSNFSHVLLLSGKDFYFLFYF